MTRLIFVHRPGQPAAGTSVARRRIVCLGVRAGQRGGDEGNRTPNPRLAKSTLGVRRDPFGPVWSDRIARSRSRSPGEPAALATRTATPARTGWRPTEP